MRSAYAPRHNQYIFARSRDISPEVHLFRLANYLDFWRPWRPRQYNIQRSYLRQNPIVFATFAMLASGKASGTENIDLGSGTSKGESNPEERGASNNMDGGDGKRKRHDGQSQSTEKKKDSQKAGLFSPFLVARYCQGTS
jgi:hypothetical protein